MIIMMIMEKYYYLMIVKCSHEAKYDAGNSKQVEHCVEKLGGETISIIAGTEKSFRS